ncbi:ABC transporter permease [Mycoplasmopsis phocirhinis]|uniref:ABC transporter permease n=1 Tax=Mycoplasmopsis phocirhinis TaxID=142650 RepID=A0A4P6MRJ0_9BACT|nr:ABC transporter permease [Mycoplasmopsis phocirhinis]QBF34679.1 ABC transporter permease [Mycoplasmopsis phocirhinis]
MWRLFKEVFKSLSKNKVVVIGLSILIFISSAVITLLSNVGNVIVGGFNNYKKVSKLHDISVDLNLPTQGQAYNQGYFVNGESLQTLAADNKKSYTPIIYDIDQRIYNGYEQLAKEYFSIDQNELYTNSLNEYMSFSDLKLNDDFLNDKYFRRDDLINLYSIYLAEKNNKIIDKSVNFDLEDVNNAKITILKNNFSFPLFTYQNNIYVPVSETITIEPEQNIFFENEIQLGKILNFKTIQNKLYATQIAPLYINVETREITENFQKAAVWINENKAFTISPQTIASVLGFTQSDEQNNIYIQNQTQKNLDSIIKNYEQPINELSVLNKQIPLSIFSQQPISIQRNINKIFNKNTTLNLNGSWIVNNQSKTQFLRNNYYTSYVTNQNSKEKWTGAFKTYIESLGEIRTKNRNPEWDELETFSNWLKLKTSIYTPYIQDSNGLWKQDKTNVQIIETKLPLSNGFDYSDITRAKLFSNDERINLLNQPYKLSQDNSLSIVDIESNSLFGNAREKFTKLSNAQKLEILNNQNILSEKYTYINSKAYDATKELIVNKITDIVGKDNIGLRQTITVDAINEQTSKQNVFHFINSGDQNFIVSGIKLNVGSLYNEQFEPSALTQLSNSTNSLYNSTQLNPYVSALLVQSIFKNLYPDPNYISPIYRFANVVDVSANGEQQTINNAKIVMLADFVNDNQNHNNKTNNLGIISVGNKYKIVQEQNNNFTIQYTKNMPLEGMDIGLLTRFLSKNNLTVALNYIKTSGSGWILQDKEFDNISYIPIYFLAPKTELINEVLRDGKIDILAQTIEKYLLNSDLVKKEFLSVDEILQVSKIIKNVLNKHNFAAVFANGKINKGILPELIIDFAYELSHSPSGDLLKTLISKILLQANKQISNVTDIEAQKEFLTAEVKNLFNTIKALTNIDLDKFLAPQTLAKSSVLPSKFINSFLKIINAIDLKKFSEQGRKWFENYNNKAITHNGTQYITKLSSGRIIEWLFSSINAKLLKQGLSELIQNLDLIEIIDLENSNSILYRLFNIFAPDLIQPLKPIFAKLKTIDNKNIAYTNVKTGIINLINSIDFDILSEELSKSIKLEFVKYNKKEFDEQNLKFVDKFYHVALDRISPKDGIISFLKSIFTLPGSSRSFKENIIKIFNLSDKVKEIEIRGTNQKVYVPDVDDQKLTFFDFAGIFASLSKTEGTSLFKNFEYETKLTSILNFTLNSSQQNYNLNDFSVEDLAFLNEFNIVTPNISKNLVVDKVKNLLLFIKQTKGATNTFLDEDKKTGTDLLFDLIKFEDGNTSWLIIKKIIESSIGIEIQNEYALAPQAFDIYSPFIQIYLNNESNLKQANKFIKEFLNFSIKPSVLALTQAKSTSENIPFENSLNYYITEYLANPQTAKIFDTDSNNNFINQDVRELLNSNPQYKKWVLNNKQLLITQLSYIGASKKFSSNSTTHPNGIYHYIINKFIENYLSKRSFYSIRHLAASMMSRIIPTIPTQIFGIPNTVANPVLRIIFPEVSLSFLASQKQDNNLINGNLAYLVLNKLGDFEQLINQDSDEFKQLNNLLENIFINKDTSLTPLNLDEEQNLLIDGPVIAQLQSKSQIIPPVFGVNIAQILPELIQDIVEPKAINEIVFNSPSSYVAKANFAYLIKNNKEIFNGQIPTDPLKINDFVNNLDSKYILNINGVKFIIVGQETTVDYIYPVIDENNLQVDTENQALVYVNNYGFSRVKLAYSGNVIKQSLLVKNNTKISNHELKKQITEIVDSSISDSNKLQRVFLANEVDPINPERSLRVSIVDSIIDLVAITTLTVLVILSFVVSVSIIFIIKRYIANKYKVLGILVAQGYSRWQIALSLSVFALLTSVIGGVLGYTVGNKLQLVLLEIFSGYWTLPKQTISFNWVSMIFTVFIPFIGMSLLIFVVALISLRYKANELISGIVTAPKSKLLTNYFKLKPKSNVKSRFSLVLALNNFWKLSAFALSVMLTGLTTMFGIASHNTFNKTIIQTYSNRHYTFRVDMQTPTLEGGPYKIYSPLDLSKNIYTPIGESIESQREIFDYFKPGYSSVINKGGLNGIANILDSDFDSHILTQFSAAIKVDAGVSADPWLVAYNSMPDSQKAKIDKSRDKIGALLEKTQDKETELHWFVDPVSKNLSLRNKEQKNVNFFKYYRSPYEKQGKFVYAYWNGDEYQLKPITTETNIRLEYRNFLIKGYRLLEQRIAQEKINPSLIIKAPDGIEPDYSKYNFWLNDIGTIYGPTINDYFISFGGVQFNNNQDEVYTYIQSNLAGSEIKIYGYKNNSQFINLVDKNGENLYRELYSFDKQNVYPLVINEIVARKRSLNVGDRIELNIDNHINRFHDKIIAQINEQTQKYTAEFEVVGINATYINSEYITTYDAANKLIGFDLFKLPDNFVKFNGILTNNAEPLQVTNSTGLYSMSGYWSGLDSFDISTASTETLKSMFDQIFNPQNGLLSKTLNANQIMKFLDPTKSSFDQVSFENIRNQPKEALTKFADIYNNKIYVALSTSIDSKDIEAGFISQISSTIQTVSIVIIALSFVISLIILVIMSTIMIGENQKNIAIWSILGYNQKEKTKMYFGVYIPFILLAILVAIPAVLLLIHIFNLFLLNFTNIALSLSLTWVHVLITTIIIFAIFIITSFITWITVNKMKPVDLLKGK